MRRTLCAGLAAALLLPTGAAAQRTPLIIDRDRIDRAPVTPPQTPAAPSVKGAQRTETETVGAPDVMLSEVTIVGSSIDRAALAPVWKPFVGKPLSQETINGVAGAIGTAYGQSDAALYTVLVPNQDFEGGKLRVRVIEGHISGIVIDDDKGKVKTRLVKAYAEKLTKEKPLRRATLERYMSLIRDIPGLTVDAMFLPGNAPDAVRLGLKLKAKNSALVFSADNRGTAMLGEFQYQASYTINGLINQGDQTILTAATAGDFDRYRYVSASHSMALDSEGTRLSLNGGYLKTRPRHSPITGDAKIAGIQLSRPLIRGYKQNVYATLAVDGVDSDNAAFGDLIAREHSRAVRGALSWSATGTKDVASANVTLSRGLDILSATNPGNLVDLTFTKVNGRVTYDRALGKAFGLHLKAAGQYSKDRMPSVETFTLGGDEFGRAFDYNAVLGDKGVAGSVELGWVPQSGLAPWMKGSTLYTFVDGGSVRLNPRGLFLGKTYTLASTGAGFRLALGKYGWVGLEQAHSLETPDGVDGGWKTIVSWRLSIH